MRHYVPQKNNASVLSHDLYMQMLYIIRDYHSRDVKAEKIASGERRWQWQAVSLAETAIRNAYQKRSETYGALDSLHAFFDYAYYSYMFSRRKSGMGAGKRGWNLYRSRFAYLVAQTLGLISCDSENRPDL